MGPDHPVMKAKLEQMNNFLAELARVIDEDALLVYSATMVWIMEMIVFLEPFLPFGYTVRVPRFPTRSRCQPISYQPRLSRGNLCLIVSFNKSFSFRQFRSSLGSLSHSTTWEALFEVFHRGDDGSELTAALELNANQIKRYLDAYRLSTSGQELDGAWPGLLAGWLDSQLAPTDSRMSAPCHLQPSRTIHMSISLGVIQSYTHRHWFHHHSFQRRCFVLCLRSIYEFLPQRPRMEVESWQLTLTRDSPLEFRTRAGADVAVDTVAEADVVGWGARERDVEGGITTCAGSVGGVGLNDLF